MKNKIIIFSIFFMGSMLQAQDLDFTVYPDKVFEVSVVQEYPFWFLVPDDVIELQEQALEGNAYQRCMQDGRMAKRISSILHSTYLGRHKEYFSSSAHYSCEKTK